ncbi:hypothetical protein [Streptomyces sp. NPDC059909]
MEKMLTCTDHFGLWTKEISHTGKQPESYSWRFTRQSLIGAAFGLDDPLG